MRLQGAHRLGRIVCAAISLLVAIPAFGWGQQGHQIVGAVAEQLLDKRTLRVIADLTDGEHLDVVGLWLDRERLTLKHTVPGSERWHYNDRPICTPSLSFEQYCPDNRCASRAYDKNLRVLKDPAKPKEQRLFALRVIVHLVGDVHQPLHAANNNDRGGNDVIVVRPGHHGEHKLHSVWDNDFVMLAMEGQSTQQFAEQLVRGNQTQLKVGSVSIDDWLEESYGLAQRQVYGQLPDFRCGESLHDVVLLTTEYQQSAVKLVKQQLLHAGIRLANVLRDNLS